MTSTELATGAIVLGITVPHMACEIIAAHLEVRLAMGLAFRRARSCPGLWR